jgi:hypothetical protein
VVDLDTSHRWVAIEKIPRSEKNPKCYYPKTFSLTTHLEYKFFCTSNWSFKLYMTWFIFYIKFEMKAFLKGILCCPKIGWISNFWGVMFLIVSPKDVFTL